jgi:hypothetical protein
MSTIDRAKLEADIAWSRDHAIAFNSTWNERFGRVLLAAESHLATLPKTKMVDRWKVEWTYKGCPGAYCWYDSPFEAANEFTRLSTMPKFYSDLKLTGPHQQEVPA